MFAFFSPILFFSEKKKKKKENKNKKIASLLCYPRIYSNWKPSGDQLAPSSPEDFPASSVMSFSPLSTFLMINKSKPSYHVSKPPNSCHHN